MPEANLSTFGLAEKSSAELEARRRELVKKLNSYPGSWDDPDIPQDDLRELATICSTLRRKNTGPPKVAKPVRGKATATKATAEDLMSMLKASVASSEPKPNGGDTP